MLYFIVLYSIFLTAVALELDLTVDVGAGKMECFFQKIKKATELEVEYQVSCLSGLRKQITWQFQNSAEGRVFSTIILSLPLIREGQLSVSFGRICTILVNCLEN